MITQTCTFYNIYKILTELESKMHGNQTTIYRDAKIQCSSDVRHVEEVFSGSSAKYVRQIDKNIGLQNNFNHLFYNHLSIIDQNGTKTLPPLISARYNHPSINPLIENWLKSCKYLKDKIYNVHAQHYQQDEKKYLEQKLNSQYAKTISYS